MCERCWTRRERDRISEKSVTWGTAIKQRSKQMSFTVLCQRIWERNEKPKEWTQFTSSKEETASKLQNRKPNQTPKRSQTGSNLEWHEYNR